MDLYIGFSKPKNHPFPILSRLIRLIERSDYSHVYLAWRSTTGPHIMYEAAGTQVRFINSKFFIENNTTMHRFKFKLTKLQYRKLIKFCMTNVGTDYGFKQLLGIAIQRIFKLKKNPLSDDKRSQVCSETVAYFLRDVLNLPINFDEEIAGPKDIYNYLMELSCQQHICQKEY